MLKIITANIKSQDYKTFVKWVIEEWEIVDQLANDQTDFEIPLPLLAYWEDKLAGGLSFIHYQSPESEDMALWINTVYVDKNFRKQKIAQSLILKAEEIAKDKGYKTLYVYSNKPQLYQQIGWSVHHEEINQALDGHPSDYVLKKVL